MWPDEWKPLPFDDFAITITGSSALISGLDYDKSYQHRVRVLRGGLSSEWATVDTKVPLPHLGHQADHTVKYQFGVISTPVPGAEASTGPGLVISAAITDASAAWNNVGSGATFTRTDAETGADVVIQGFWDTQVGKGTGKHCGISIACMQSGSSHPHLASGRVLYIEEPPHWGHHADAKMWTNDFKKWHRKQGDYQYLRKTLMHEFGHALGLGHSPRGDVMSGGVPVCGAKPNFTFCGLTANDKNGVKEIYRGHTAHQ